MDSIGEAMKSCTAGYHRQTLNAKHSGFSRGETKFLPNACLNNSVT